MATTSTSHPYNVVLLWTARAITIFALALSLYLSWHALTQQEVGGCGTTSDCNYVLGSRWSNWLGVPVAMLGAGNYLLLLFALSWAGPRAQEHQRRAAWAVVAALASIAALAAAYFVGLQFLVLHAFCPWCLATHLCAMVIATIVSIALWKNIAGFTSVGRWPELLGMLVAVIVIASLITGQILRPGSYRVTALAHPLELPRGLYPTMGPPDAPHVVIMLGDYTCPHCRSMHGYLAHACQAYGNQIAVVIMPVPMNRKCNPAIKVNFDQHRYACELNRLALVVWRADPAAWRKLDEWLVGSSITPTPDDARKFAESLLGAETLKKAEADPWPDQAIQRDVEIYTELGAGAVPKLLAGNDVIEKAEWEGAVFKALEHSLGVKRTDTPP